MQTVDRHPPNKKRNNKYRPISHLVGHEKLHKNLEETIILLTSDILDLLQCVEDAKLFIIGRIYKHLEQPESHDKLLFAHFSSAFKMMQPHTLFERLVSHFMPPDQIVLMTFNFLTNRLQQVFCEWTVFFYL